MTETGKTKKDKRRQEGHVLSLIVVPKVGFEPTLSCENQILSLARLPVSPLRHVLK
jgi:hypothetical protein